ncbi:MerR family transcriptional regulator [Solwaraspora sp. WMMD406]|uniref:MerR family transcriptional regulator n=1 Tax=Solwaraspora sp. WMMD406 TaxID=3016095 RepID=UPI002415FDB5|nr:MerR family transcriptional regulator [Solwaraspora sp. WMMD406]MDG4763147.1 MerR family transcriptional regulator [Solwaraspora sp. WMMD406]
MGDDALSAGSVARRLGVAVTTLRTWHQRYGLGPTQHVKGHHRRYSQEDLARLEVMRRLTADGVAPAEAARWARRAPWTRSAETAETGEPTGTDVSRVPGPAGASQASGPAGVGQVSSPAGVSRAGGGFTIGVGAAGPVARGLARAAVRLDNGAMRDIIERALRTDGVVATWEHVLRPVLAGLGDRYAATSGFIEVEHLLSRCVSEAFATVTRPATSGGSHRGGPGVLLACADEEQHTLPLEALAAALTEAGVVSRLLGARVPAAALVAATDRTGPSAVVVWSHSASTADPAQLSAVRTGRHRPLLVLATGPGWTVDQLPDGVAHAGTLASAVTLCQVADQTVASADPEPAGETWVDPRAILG